MTQLLTNYVSIICVSGLRCQLLTSMQLTANVITYPPIFEQLGNLISDGHSKAFVCLELPVIYKDNSLLTLTSQFFCMELLAPGLYLDLFEEYILPSSLL